MNKQDKDWMELLISKMSNSELNSFKNLIYEKIKKNLPSCSNVLSTDELEMIASLFCDKDG